MADASGAAILRSGPNAVALARARASLATHEAEFRSLEATALSAHADGDPLAAVAWAQIASHVAWARPCESLTAPALERMLHEIGRAHVPGGETDVPDRDPERVLHVITEAYSIGGHTRVMERWIDRDHRHPTVVLTGEVDPPPNLSALLARRGGALVRGLAGDDVLERARALRRLAAEHDLVVLHVHMHDVLASLAFADPRGRPPTIHFDHAAHQFWIGTAVADVVASMRATEAETARARRGFPAQRTVRLPLPLARRPLPTRAAARERLGIAPDVPLVLTVVSPWKVQPSLRPTFAEISSRVLDALPDAVHLVVGPAPDAEWTPALRRHGTRLRMPGGVEDLSTVLAAADVYLDSWPVSGATTLLDVAAAGIPVVSLAGGVPQLVMLCAADTLGAGAAIATSPDDVARTVAQLFDDAARRDAMRRAMTDVVDATHDAGWTRHMEAVVTAARRHRAVAAPLHPPPLTSPQDWECVVQTLMHAKGAPRLEGIAYAHAKLLPEPVRRLDASGFVDLIHGIARGGARRASGEDPVQRPRAVIQPSLAPAAVQRAVERLRELVARDAVSGCVVVVAEDEVERALPLLQAALDAGDDIDIDVVTAAAIADVAQPDDLVLHPEEQHEAGARVRAS